MATSPASELTTRDILMQIDQRLSLVEQDLRGFDGRFTHVDVRFSRIDERLDRIDERFERVDSKMDERFERVDDRSERLQHFLDGKFERLNTKVDLKFRWSLGIMLASWLSIMGTLLLKN